MALAQQINGRLRRVPAWPVYIGGLIPLIWLAWQIYTGNLGVDPVKTLEHKVGKIGLQFLVAVLCVTPLRRLTGISLIKFRRALGLLAFFYVCT
jgi:methionine sulfoxide reductase heme-binding subunit